MTARSAARPASSSTLRIVCIVPFLDEQRHLGQLLDSMDAQHRSPDELLLVDDGSSDQSPALAADFAKRHTRVRLLRRPRRAASRDRLANAPELVAFESALAQVSEAWDVVVKLDADLVLSPDLFATLERAFIQQPDLGVAGTFLSVLDPKTGKLQRERCPPSHVRGATKCYRRACYEQIAPLPAMLGWDTVDEIAARSHGWRTASIACPAGDTVHLRPTGGETGQLRAQFRWGMCAYGIGQHPAWVSVSALRRLLQRPRVLASTAFLAGWFTALVRQAPRASAELRAFGQREQIDVLRSLVRGPGAVQRAIRFGTEPTAGS
jgi:biofilm PGA synthesis N-glycosyltransferase PgaC